MAKKRAPLEIVQVGHPVLRQVARPLTLEELASARIQKLVEQMRDTMRAAPGVGLAAPQIGESLQLFVVEDKRDDVPFHVFVNPTLTIRSEEAVLAYEGCLSFEGFSMIVPRAHKVRIEGLNEHGEKVTKVASGWYARILQHEFDHLNGMVCIDRADTRTLTTPANFDEFVAKRDKSRGAS